MKKTKQRKAAKSVKKTYLHVDPNIMRSNKLNGENEPAVVVISPRTGKRLVSRARITGPSTLVSKSHEPLEDGATAWVETTSKVRTYTDNPNKHQSGFFFGCG